MHKLPYSGTLGIFLYIMEEFKDMVFEGERALFKKHGIKVDGCVFKNGESALKESSSVTIMNSLFKWRYPIWYANDITITGSSFFDDTRAGFWYCKNVSVSGSSFSSPKSFRRSIDLSFKDVSLLNAAETLWFCHGVSLENVVAEGDYFLMNSDNVDISSLTLKGKYSFDGVRGMRIKNSRLITKDAFWNSEDVTVENSFISSEYLGWNSKNLTLIDCEIESLQGMCYIDGLKMINCRLTDSSLSFEHSSVDVDVSGGVESVFNPESGRIKADRINKLIMQEGEIDPDKTEIICPEIIERTDTPDFPPVSQG